MCSGVVVYPYHEVGCSVYGDFCVCGLVVEGCGDFCYSGDDCGEDGSCAAVV